MIKTSEQDMRTDWQTGLHWEIGTAHWLGWSNLSQMVNGPIKVSKGSGIFFNISISLKSCSGRVLFKKTLLVHKLSKVTQGNFDVECSFKQILNSQSKLYN